MRPVLDLQLPSKRARARRMFLRVVALNLERAHDALCTLDLRLRGLQLELIETELCLGSGGILLHDRRSG
jgi:hypothetical protein